MPKQDKDAKNREKAQKILDRAEILFDREEWMRAHREFTRAGSQYLEMEEYRVAEQCFLFSSKALSTMKRVTMMLLIPFAHQLKRAFN